MIGVSYAAFAYVGRGSQVNQITTGTISMEYVESDNVISINNALPTTDETGKVRLRDGEYFDFSVTTTLDGNAMINFEIASVDFDDNTFDGENVKFYLTKLVGSEEVEVNSNLPAVYKEEQTENKKTGRPIGMMSLLTGTVYTQGQETTNYRLRLYVDEEYNPQGDGGSLIFKTRINVYGKTNSDADDLLMMKSYNGGYKVLLEDFHQSIYKQAITKIVIKNDTNILDTAVLVENGKGNYFDVSAAGNNSVIAYLEENGNVMVDEGKEATAYKLTIGAKNKVIANNDSAYLFSDFPNLKEIDLTYLDTSKATDFGVMFNDCSSLISLDLRGFDTKGVVGMNGMFFGCSSLINLDISSFDTSKVSDMACMFTECSSLTDLDVSNFNTVSVIDMSSMFYGCSSLTSLDVSNFNTSNVTSMMYLFSGCSSLTSLDISSFNTAKVIDMFCMFTECSSLTSLDLQSFDTSNVANMSQMFMLCQSLTNIMVSTLWDTNLAASTNVDGFVYGTDAMFDACGVDHVTVI